MIKQMERKFTIVAISVTSLVLLVLIILVNVISTQGNIQRADDSLNRIAYDIIDGRKDPRLSDGVVGDDNAVEVDIPPIINNRDEGKELNRSFEVILDHDLTFISTNSNMRNIIADDLAYEMAVTAAQGSKERGFVDDFRYLIVEDNKELKVIFLDYSFEKQSETGFIYVSIGAYFASIILVTFLVNILLKPVMKSIKESYAKQRQFITDASHELKTPLTVISTDMQIIEMDHGSSEWIKSVNQQITKLNSLTNELVTLSRMDEEGIHIVMGQVNLSDIVNDVVMGFEPAFNAKDKELVVEIEDDLKIKGNHDSLERVMSILLNNALKYSDDKGSISVKVYQKNKKVKIVVKNSVDQIDKGNHEEFFERFYRSDESRNSQTGGFGIGLAVAKSIIEEHKGKIEAKSVNEQSLEISISLKA